MMKRLINREIRIDDNEGEIVDVIGCQWCIIQFFDVNIDNCKIHIDEIDNYLIRQ